MVMVFKPKKSSDFFSPKKVKSWTKNTAECRRECNWDHGKENKVIVLSQMVQNNGQGEGQHGCNPMNWGGSTNHIISVINMGFGWNHPRPTFFAVFAEFCPTNLFTRGTNQWSRMEPRMGQETDMKFLSRIKASEGLVHHFDMQATILAMVAVTPGSPMLPLTNLFAIHFFPHLVSVIKTLGSFTIALQSKVTFWTCKHKYCQKIRQIDVGSVLDRM